MGTRAIRYTAVLAAITALTACTTPPEPPLASPGPVLDPQAIAYDNVDFRLDRPEVFDNTCETLPPNLQSLVEATEKPRSTPAGCRAETEWGDLMIALFNPGAGRKSNAQHFVDVWNGERLVGHYFQRSILLDRYYATTMVSGEVNEHCTVTVDTGSEMPLEVEASMDFNDSIALKDQDVDQPIDKAMQVFCPAAKSAAEKLLQLIDENGGSRAR